MTPYEVYQNFENFMSLLKPEGLLFIQSHVLSPRVSKNLWDELFQGNVSFKDYNNKTGAGSFFLGYIISQFYKDNGIPCPGFFEPEHYGNIDGLYCNKNFFYMEFDQFIEEAIRFGFKVASSKSHDLENFEYKETESFTGIGTLGIFTFQKPKKAMEAGSIDVLDLFEQAETLPAALDELYARFEVHSCVEIKRNPISHYMFDAKTKQVVGSIPTKVHEVPQYSSTFVVYRHVLLLVV